MWKNRPITISITLTQRSPGAEYLKAQTRQTPSPSVSPQMAGGPESLYVRLENREMVTSANIYCGSRVCKRKEFAGEREYRTQNTKEQTTLLDRIHKVYTDETAYREKKRQIFSFFENMAILSRRRASCVTECGNKNGFPRKPLLASPPSFKQGLPFFLSPMT